MATAAGSTGSDNAHVIESGALVCESVTLAGSYRVVIGAGTIVQPNVVIVAQDGPIIIGEKNIIEENVVILNAKEEGQGEGATKELRIGKMNLFCTGVRIEQCTIGNINIFEPKSIVRQGCTVGNAACLGPTVELYAGEHLADEHVHVRSEPPTVKTRFRARGKPNVGVARKNELHLENVVVNSPPMMKERNISRVQRYSEALRDESGRSCMKKHHAGKLKIPI